MSAVVTGGASGLGAATAVMLADRGAMVAILDTDEMTGRKIATEIGGQFIWSTYQARLMSSKPSISPKPRSVNCAGIAPLRKHNGEAGS